MAGRTEMHAKMWYLRNEGQTAAGVIRSLRSCAFGAFMIDLFMNGAYYRQ